MSVALHLILNYKSLRFEKKLVLNLWICEFFNEQISQPSRTATAAMRRSTDKAIETRSTFRCLPSGTQKSGRRGIFPDRDGARTTVECVTALLKNNSNRAKKLQWHGNWKKKHSLICNCPPEPKKQASEGSSPRKTKLKPPLNVAAHSSFWEHDAPSFDLGISPPTSQLTSPASQPMVTQFEILAEAVIDAGVAVALKFADATSAESSFTAAEVYKTPEKEKEIMEELMEKCYHWITHVKETKDSTNEYDAIFVLNHEANFEGLRHHFLSLMPEQHVESTVVNAHCMILNDIKYPRFQEEIYCVPTDIVMFMLKNYGENHIDPKTNKTYRIDVDQYAHYCRINNLPDEDLHWGKTLNRGQRGRRSRVYRAEWSTYKLGSFIM
ncbi:hypothetical protein Ahy_B06g084424 [Arachis hypogaea]|uniref:Uncharacterized protein n=1 Tax=Arachis hypogaea TaxID=3818 RepID=A0A444YRV6_ARAHY|nr:hypothetical protein Ahy_B06g084424 [Arachis hypogaea]